MRSPLAQIALTLVARALGGLALGALALGGAGACTGGIGGYQDTGLEGLAVDEIAPGLLVPGSRILVRGRSFVGPEIGETELRLVGTFAGLDGDEAQVSIALPARFLDYELMDVSWPGAIDAGLPSEIGAFQGVAILSSLSLIDGRRYEADPVPVDLEIEADLVPRLDVLQTGVIFVNDPIVVEGSGFLLGGEEGDTFAVVEGCYRREGTTSCQPVAATEVKVTPEPQDRTRATFPFSPAIAGIRPGFFQGTVKLRNRHGSLAGRVEHDSAPDAAEYDVVPPTIFSVDPPAASLGQYVDIRGGGFVGVRPGAPNPESYVTTLELSGTFRPAGGGSASVSLTLIPEFVSGPLVRYVVNEDDELGAAVDLRKVAGSFEGTIRPVIHDATDTVVGDSRQVTLGIAHVKQVVFLNFLPSYVESLRHFGLRAVDDRIRRRILEVARRDFAGVNVEFRTEWPDDFALFAQVDIAGPDPNGLGLFGYDNSPGKDTGNVRLYDKIGGVNATTQEDGYPGYGGVFVESFFGLSPNPGGFAERLDGASPLFDVLFDPFRPDRGGRPVRAADLAEGSVPELADGAACPVSSDRPLQIACAVFALGSMIGTTLTHEVGHSLGLANPYGEGFHDPGDQPNRLMDSGGARTFEERVELLGEGPAVFCEDAYLYLEEILPSAEPDPLPERPSCF